jgi:hypothetical protein
MIVAVHVVHASTRAASTVVSMANVDTAIDAARLEARATKKSNDGSVV